MTVSERQLKANRENAKKGGVKTDEGKALVRTNALKHGLLAKEIVITAGEGAEDPAEFEQVLNELLGQLTPVGSVEEMLVEKIAASYWRLRRAYRFEVGFIRRELDNATESYFAVEDWQGKKVHGKQEEIEKKVAEEKESIEYWDNDKKELQQMFKKGTALEEIVDWDMNWEDLQEKLETYLESKGLEIYVENPEIIHFLRKLEDWDDKRIWKTLIENCGLNVREHQEKLRELEAELAREKEKNRMGLQVKKQLAAVPAKDTLDRLLRYEAAIQRQFYKALTELERLQRLRLGDAVPPPVKISVEVEGDATE